MIFALLFILAFLFGLGIYSITREWMKAVAITLIIFCVAAVFDQSENALSMKFVLIFGVPIVFFASLLGCYVVQIRSPGEENLKSDATNEANLENEEN